MRIMARALLCAVAVVCLAAAPAATLSGSVVSVAGGSLPGARVTLAHQESGRQVVVVCGERGLFKATRLAPGEWSVVAELEGFHPVSASLTIAPGEARTLEMTLSPSTLTESLTVTAEAPRDSLEASAIRESPARDLGEALSVTPGVWTLRKGGIANEIVLRGLQSRDVSMLIDGQRINGACPNHMDPPAFHVDFAEVDRVEIAKGPFDVRNQGSLGGTINVLTRQPGTGWRITPQMASGSWGYLNPSATVSYGRRGLSFLGGFSHRSASPYEDASGTRFTEGAGYRPDAIGDDAFRVGTGWARTWFEPAPGHAVRISWTRQQADHVYYPYLLMDAVDDDTDRGQLSWDFTRTGAIEKVSAQAYFARVDHWMTDAHRTSSLTAPRDYSMGSLAVAHTSGGRLEARLRRASAGVEFAHRSWDVTTEMAGMAYAPQHAVPGVSVDVTALYAETSLPMAGGWTFHGGARLDWARSTADETEAPLNLYEAYHETQATAREDFIPSGNVRLVWKNDDGVEFGAGLGRTGRVPEPNERWFGLRRSGTDWVGNPGLEPSLNTGVSLSLSVRRAGRFVGASLFGQQIDDFIVVYGQPRRQTVPGVMNTLARSYTNNDATLWGGEISGALPITRQLSIAGDLSYVRGTQDEDPGRGITSRDLAEMPPLRLRTSMRFNAARGWAEVEAVFSSAQNRVDQDLLEESTPAWGVAHVACGAQWRELDFTLGVSNVFNRLYAEHLSYQRDPYRSGVQVNEPGRSIFGNVSYRF